MSKDHPEAPVNSIDWPLTCVYDIAPCRFPPTYDTGVHRMTVFEPQPKRVEYNWTPPTHREYDGPDT